MGKDNFDIIMENYGIENMSQMHLTDEEFKHILTLIELVPEKNLTKFFDTIDMLFKNKKLVEVAPESKQTSDYTSILLGDK
jgi:hypothetical protein